MSRIRRGTGGGLEDFDVLHDDDTDIDLFSGGAGASHAGSPRPRRGDKGKAAWQRVDERREIKALKAQLEDWDDWDGNWPDESRDDALDAPSSL